MNESYFHKKMLEASERINEKLDHWINELEYFATMSFEDEKNVSCEIAIVKYLKSVMEKRSRIFLEHVMLDEEATRIKCTFKYIER